MKKGNKTFYTLLAVGSVILLLWLLKRGSNTNIVNQGSGGITNVNIPAFDLPPKTGIVIPPMPGLPPIDVTFPPVTIPGLPSSDFYNTNYNMRSACACGNGSVPYYITQQAPPPTTQPLSYPPVTQPVPQSSYWGPPVGPTTADYFNTGGSPSYWG